MGSMKDNKEKMNGVDKLLIDVSFDFTTDTPHFWDDAWSGDDVLGNFDKDPDKSSKTLQRYHQILWSKMLPNGEFLELQIGRAANYLTWNGFRFGSDSITTSFRYKRYKHMLENVAKSIPNYREFFETYLRKTYTIGGEIIFPKWHGGINQSRGCNPYLRDRWDLTLECIKKYYDGETSPLYNILLKDKGFFDLFINFKGFIDFFFLQDCVSVDYKTVNFWLGDGQFTTNPLPATVEDYLLWLDNQLKFVERRNTRIRDYCKMH